MLTRSLFLAVFGFAIIALPACATTTEEGDCVDCMEGEGTVRYSQVEGGFYYIEADDGSKYDPHGMPKEVAVDGARVHFVVRPQPDRMGFHMVGTIVELVEITLLESGEPVDR